MLRSDSAVFGISVLNGAVEVMREGSVRVVCVCVCLGRRQLVEGRSPEFRRLRHCV